MVASKTLTTSEQMMCELRMAPERDCEAMVTGVLACQNTGAGWGYALGRLWVEYPDLSPIETYELSAMGQGDCLVGEMATYISGSQVWKIPLKASTRVILRLNALKGINAGGVDAHGGRTTLTALVLE